MQNIDTLIKGVPFYPAGQYPKAVCPLCADERNDRQPKRLYTIRGHSPGEYDEEIPKAWFDTPPIKLGGSGQGMDALRVFWTFNIY